jgi:tRNA(Arg) A34 adenosine deaminase TadA
MCLSALYWARVKRICFGNTKEDARAIDFDDQFIYDQLSLDYARRSIPCSHFMRDVANEAFRRWASKTDKTAY